MEENYMVKDFEERGNMLAEVSANLHELSISNQLRFVQEFIDFTDKIKPLYAELKMNKGETFFMKL